MQVYIINTVRYPAEFLITIIAVFVGQDLLWLVWLAQRCLVTVCLGTLSTQHHGWNQQVKV